MHARREFLAATGLVATAALAGCSALVGDDDEVQVDVESDFRDFLPAFDGPLDIDVTNPASFIDLEDDEQQLFGTPTSEIVHLVDATVGDPFAEDSPEALLVGVGTFEPESSREAFESDQNIQATADGEYGDYDIFTTGSDDGAFSVLATREEVVIAGTDRELVESVIDAEREEAARLVEESEPVETVVEELGEQDMLLFEVDERALPAAGEVDGDESALDSGLLVRGQGFDFGAEESSFVEASIYDTAESAADDETTAIERWEDGEEGTSDVEATREGRLLVVTGTQQTDDVRFLN